MKNGWSSGGTRRCKSRGNVSVQRALPGSRSGPTMKTFNFFTENKIIGDPY